VSVKKGRDVEERTKIKMIGGRVIDTFFVHSRIILIILRTTKKISGIPRIFLYLQRI